MKKVFHIESGLGNQMLDYTDLLASKSCNPNDEFFIETILYELGNKQDGISMWNGYELDRIFGIQERNVKELFSEKKWHTIIDSVIASEFWNDGWTYSDAICDAFSEHGLSLINQYRREHNKLKVEPTEISHMKYLLKNLYYRIRPSLAYTTAAIPEKLFFKSETDDYNGHYLKFMYKGNEIEKLNTTIRETFRFPEYDGKNLDFATMLRSSNSVAIHARRGDFLGHNSYCYCYGYFKRAVHYIKSHVSNPIFVFFCDPGSIAWCKENGKIFDLDFTKDNVQFVDWNLDTENYRDMQLMSDCKHNIITNSSFGWWGAYLNANPDKITCSPDPKINTTHWF
jgi:hypothetical protein